MRLFKALTLASLLLAVSTPALSQGKRQTFNPDGSFWIIGEAPKGFSDFGGINLNGRQLRRIPTQGLQLMNGKTFHFKTLTVKRDNFSFTTRTLGGVHYTFVGKFLRGGRGDRGNQGQGEEAGAGAVRGHRCGITSGGNRNVIM